MIKWKPVSFYYAFLVSPTANTGLLFAPSGKALILGLKCTVKFAEGD
jgi:hypothetical protein